MAKEQVKFIATKYKTEGTTVAFYKKTGERVSFKANEKVPVKEEVKFFVKDRSQKPSSRR
jgi:hypothetical protein